MEISKRACRCEGIQWGEVAPAAQCSPAGGRSGSCSKHTVFCCPRARASAGRPQLGCGAAICAAGRPRTSGARQRVAHSERGADAVQRRPTNYLVSAAGCRPAVLCWAFRLASALLALPGLVTAFSIGQRPPTFPAVRQGRQHRATVGNWRLLLRGMVVVALSNIAWCHMQQT